MQTNRRSFLAASAAAVAIAAPSVAIATATTDDAALEAAWSGWQQARRAYNKLPFPDDEGVDTAAIRAEENRLWRVMDSAEETIRATNATTPHGTSIQLWIALAHSVDEQGHDDAIAREDLAAILARETELDWEARLIVAALRSTQALS